MHIESDCPFKQAYNGRFSGVLRWPQFERLWTAVQAAPEGWHVYEPEAGPAPSTPLSKEEMLSFLKEAEEYLRENCMRDCCGAVYADSFDEPSFIKVYNPRLMGGCGMGKAPLPHWLISRMPPVNLIEHEPEAQERGILGQMFGAQS